MLLTVTRNDISLVVGSANVEASLTKLLVFFFSQNDG